MGAISAANLTRLRTTRHGTKLAAVIYPPPTIWSARVNGAQTLGSLTITVDGVAQVRAPAANFLVKFGNYAGSDNYGTARFVSYAAPTLTVTAHNTDLIDDLYVTVVEWVPPVAVLPTIDDNDVVFEDGNVAYTSDAVNQKPIARCGADAFAYLNAVPEADINFYDHGSEAFNGATIASVLWTWRGGTVVAGSTVTAGTAGVPNTVRWTAIGNYYCSYTVTDSNGQTHTRYFIVYIRERYVTTAGLEVFTQIGLESLEGDTESGAYHTTVTVYGAYTTETLIPHGVPCLIVAEDWFGTEKVSIGHELYRENIVFAGYIRKGTVKKNWAIGAWEFEVDSVSGVIENLWQIAGGLETKSADNTYGWHVLDGLTYNLAIHHMLVWHSTITQIADCWFNLPTYTIEYVDIPDSSLADGLRQAFAAVRSRMGCSREGSLYFELNPQLQTFNDRSVTYVIQTTNADYREDLDFGDENSEKQVCQIDFEGLDDNAEPLFALAPPSPWASGKSERVDGIRVEDQDESNEFSGLYEGWRNNTWSEIVVPWRGNYRALDLFPAEPIALNLAAADNPRGYAWTNVRCWLKRCTLEYRDTILTVTTVLEADSYGPPGVPNNFTPLPPPIPNPTPVQPTPTPVPPPNVPVPYSGGAWLPNVYLLTDLGVYYSSNFTGPGGAMPTWTKIDAGLPADFTYRWMQPDPFRPGDQQFLLIRNNDWDGSGTARDEIYVRTTGAWSKLVDSDQLATAWVGLWTMAPTCVDPPT